MRNHYRILQMFALIGLFLSMQAQAAPLDRFWPHPAHDLHRSRYSATKNQLAEPVMRWRAFLGGLPVSPHALDVDFDNREDVIAVEGGRAVARRQNGALLWSSLALGATALGPIADFNGDGTPDVVVVAQTAVHVISSANGKIVFSSPAGQLPDVSFVSADDRDGDGLADLAYAGSGGGGQSAKATTFVYRLVGAPQLLAKTDTSPPTVQIAATNGERSLDIDGDGLADFLLPGLFYVYAFSGKTGALIAVTAKLKQFPGGNVQAFSVPSKLGGAPLLVMSASYVYGVLQKEGMEGLMALRQKGKLLEEVWSMSLPDLAKDRFACRTGGMGDLDGDGQAEILYGRFQGGVWTLEVRDALTGAILHSLGPTTPWLGGAGGLQPVVTAKFYATGPFVTLAVAGTTESVAPIAHWHAVRWTRATGFESVADLGLGGWSEANVLPGLGKWKQLQWSVAPLAGGLGTTAQLLMQRDGNGEGSPDTLEIIDLPQNGKPKEGGPKLKIPPGAGARLTLLEPNGSRHLMLGYVDGHAPIFDAQLKITNDLDKDQQADLRYGGGSNPAILVAPVHDADATPLILLSNGASAYALDPVAADSLHEPKVVLQIESRGALPNIAMADVNGDGAREFVVRTRPLKGTASVTAYDVAGKQMWKYAHPKDNWFWQPTQLNGLIVYDANADGADDLLLQFTLPGLFDPAKIYNLMLDGKTQKALWTDSAAAAANVDAAAALDDGDPAKPRWLWSSYYLLTMLDAKDGTSKTQAGLPTSSGVAIAQDLNKDGKMDLVVPDGAAGPAAYLAPDWKVAWFDPISFPGRSNALWPMLGGFYVVVAPNVLPNLQVRDAANGKILWSRMFVDGKSYALDSAPSSSHTLHGMVAVQDLVGLGHANLVFRDTAGYLYAVNAQDGSVDWAINWGGLFGDPIAADIDGDGEVEILTTFSDGYLYALDKNKLGKAAWAREHDATGPALTAQADIDVQESTTQVLVNWAALDNAAAYSVQLVDSTGYIVSPWRDVGGLTDGKIDGLLLLPGETYRTQVAGREGQGLTAAQSQVVESDGVTIVDNSPPRVDALAVQPVAVPMAHTGGQITGQISDATRLASWQMRILNDVGKNVFEKSAKTTAPSLGIDVAWDGLDSNAILAPPGQYTVQLTARDDAAHEASKSVPLTVCGPLQHVENGKCVSGLEGVDAGGTVDANSLNGSLANDCRATPRAADGGWAAFGLVAGLALLIARNRRRI